MASSSCLTSTPINSSPFCPKSFSMFQFLPFLSFAHTVKLFPATNSKNSLAPKPSRSKLYTSLIRFMKVYGSGRTNTGPRQPGHDTDRGYWKGAASMPAWALTIRDRSSFEAGYIRRWTTYPYPEVRGVACCWWWHGCGGFQQRCV
uniref:Uncharacterized protein n=1 Tax=Manihot esculenta TaxID=3983 RepID=A0A2C9W9P5_MANES